MRSKFEKYLVSITFALLIFFPLITNSPNCFYRFFLITFEFFSNFFNPFSCIESDWPRTFVTKTKRIIVLKTECFIFIFVILLLCKPIGNSNTECLRMHFYPTAILVEQIGYARLINGINLKS